MCAIASISFDHTQYLGDTLAQIAREKSGIIKLGSRVAIYPKEPPEALAVLQEACQALLIQPNIPDLGQLEVLECGEEGSRIRYKGRELHIPLLGEHQIYNALTVCAIFEELDAAGWSFPWQTVAQGIAKASFNGRMEVVHRQPLCLVDGAHNPDGVDSLCHTLDTLYRGRDVTVVMGMLADKDYAYGIRQVASRASRFIATTPVGTPRALPAEQAAQAARPYCAQVEVIEAPSQAAQRALELALEHQGMAIACGSLYMIGEAKQGFCSAAPLVD